jgi:hypothetical protein
MQQKIICKRHVQKLYAKICIICEKICKICDFSVLPVFFLIKCKLCKIWESKIKMQTMHFLLCWCSDEGTKWPRPATCELQKKERKKSFYSQQVTCENWKCCSVENSQETYEEICRIWKEICIICNKRCKICKTIHIVCILCNWIFKIIWSSMYNMQNMQINTFCIFCIFCIFKHAEYDKYAPCTIISHIFFHIGAYLFAYWCILFCIFCIFCTLWYA